MTVKRSRSRCFRGGCLSYVVKPKPPTLSIGKTVAETVRLNLRKIAMHENVSFQSVYECIEKARKKLLEFLKNYPDKTPLSPR